MTVRQAMTDGRSIKDIPGDLLGAPRILSSNLANLSRSVTPLKANYLHASNVSMGELKL